MKLYYYVTGISLFIFITNIYYLTPVNNKHDIVYVCGLTKELDEEFISRIYKHIKPDYFYIIIKTSLQKDIKTPVTYLDEPAHLPSHRIEKMSVLRNLCLNKIKGGTLIWIDMDMGIPDKSLNIANTLIHKETEYNIICANGRSAKDDFPYDISATIFADGNFAYHSKWQVYPYLNRKVDYNYVRLTIPRGHGYMPVTSCFGGMAIYKIDLHGCKYSYQNNSKYFRYMYNDRQVCEHVPFHFCLIDKGAKLAVKQDMLTFWSKQH